MFCTHCGTEVGDHVQFCTRCGQPTSGALAPVRSATAVWSPPTMVHASAGRWIGEGWDLVKADLGNYAVLTLLFGLLSGVPLIGGSLIAGFHIFSIKKLERRHAQIGDLFQGFNYFVHALIASLIIGFFVFVGTLLLIIPGLIVAAMYKFTYLFIVDKRMEFWDAMKASHAVVKNDYLGFTWFLILAFLVNVLGFCCLLVGLLVTIPVTFAAITIAYREIVGFEPSTVNAL